MLGLESLGRGIRNGSRAKSELMGGVLYTHTYIVIYAKKKEKNIIVI